MELSVQVEKPSSIVRKLKIRVPAKEVANRFNRGLAEVQRTAKIKGFRPGQVPLNIVKQFYGNDVRHQVYHNLIDESFQEAVREQQLKAVGRPTIEEGAEHKTGHGEHDHAIHEDQDLTFTATVEVLPEIEVKNYTGVALTQEKHEITNLQVDDVVRNMLESQAEIVPVTEGGLVQADGTQSSRPVKKGDHVDLNFSGGVVNEGKVELRDDMKGQRVLEVGSDSLIPGFEDQLVGMRRGETKTFRIGFPADFYAADLAGKESEFTVTVNELKEKKLPELNDEFAKQAGYENVGDLQAKAREHLEREKKNESEGKLRSELVKQLIEKNPFDVPQVLIESQTRALAQDWAEELKRQGANEDMIRGAITQELENLKTRAESQVRASLLLEAIATKENIAVSDEDFTAELKKQAEAMQMPEDRLQEFYAKNPGRKEDFTFRLRQERTLKFLLDKAKIKS